MFENEKPIQEPDSSGGAVGVVLRLVDGDRLEAGIFTDEQQARRSAEELVATLGRADWPFVGGRYVRPEAVVSVDLVHESHPRWTGSTGRAAPWTSRADE